MNIENILSSAFTNPYSKTILTLLLVLYGGLAAPKLPKKVVELFDNNIFRIIYLSLIVYLGHKDPKFAIMVAIGFVVSMDALNKYKIYENFNRIKKISSVNSSCNTCLGASNIENFSEDHGMDSHHHHGPGTPPSYDHHHYMDHSNKSNDGQINISNGSQTSIGGCEGEEFGCCLDGVTPASSNDDPCKLTSEQMVKHKEEQLASMSVEEKEDSLIDIENFGTIYGKKIRAIDKHLITKACGVDCATSIIDHGIGSTFNPTCHKCVVENDLSKVSKKYT